MRLSLLLLLAGLTLSLAPAEEAKPAEPATAPAAPAASAGQKYAISLVSTDGEKNDDVLIFADDTLSSQGYADSRFVPGKVTIRDRGDTKTFEATMISPRGAEAIWSGKITGDSVEGRVLTGVKGRFDIATFSGTLQK